MRVLRRRLPDGTDYEVGWDGRPLHAANGIAFDTETDIVELLRFVPRLACFQASDGERHLIISGDQLPAFVLAHRDALWIAHNAAFDWPVVLHELRRQGGHEAPEAEKVWWDLLDGNRISDTMILDFLVRLADPRGNPTHLRGLGELGLFYLGRRDVDKQSKYRKEFGKIIGADWSDVDPGYWDYAMTDALVTHTVWWRIAERLGRHKPADSWHRHGPLTEGLQVRAAVVLGEIGRVGFALDRPKLTEVKARLKSSIDLKALALESQAPGIFRRYKVKSADHQAGDLMVQKNTGTAKMDTTVLRAKLTQVAEESDIDPETLPRTEKTRQLTTSQEPWVNACGDHQWVKAWCDLNDETKLHQFLTQLDGVSGLAVHASYQPLVRTGRTSCRRPNIQQMPREPWLRELFVARPGKRLVIVDYSAIELVTLAAVLVDRFGGSVLADQIKAGRDPHAYTAALVQGVSYEEFLGWKKERPDEFKTLRQAAKAINFGVPGGLGAARLADYARANYQVELTKDQAVELRDKLVTVVYPELSLYLEDDLPQRLADNLGKTREEVVAVFAKHLRKDEVFQGFWFLLDRIVGGSNTRKDGELYAASVRQAVWDGLAELTRGHRAYADCKARKGSIPLWRDLVGGEAVTLTGRVRKALLYTEARNTPFQGLAADGAKVALYRLWRSGYDIVAFVHDEIVCEVPQEGAEGYRERIEAVMVDAMASVLGTDIPVKVEGKVSEKWVK